MNGYLFSGLMIAILVAAATLRLVDLANRPMHCDEAVHAIKFGQLLESHEYKYNPYEYHGPSLNYLTLPVAWLSGRQRLTEVSEAQLRLVPAVFGILLVGLVWPLRRQLGDAATLCVAALTAFSPGLVFYSRYYVQEMLLVCFTFGAVVAWFRFLRGEQDSRGLGHPDLPEHARRLPEHARRRVRSPFLWLIGLGVCLGMMHGSKETCVIAMFAAAVGSLALVRDGRQFGAGRWAVAALVTLVTTACVSAAFFSAFGRHPQGVLDSFMTYGHYLGRAAGQGSAGQHVHPWHYYFRILFWRHEPGGPVWTEGLIAALAVAGLVAGALGKGLAPSQIGVARFFSIYTVILAVVYSAIPYKTPWCAVGLLHGMVLLAGIGAVALVRIVPGYFWKGVVILALVAATGHLAYQAYRASFVAYEDRHNPYVYSHTTRDVLPFVELIRRIALAHPDGKAVHIQVICPDDDYWPLPWYLREFRQVGWFAGEPRGQDGRPLPAAPIIITQPPLRDVILNYNYRRQPPGRRHLMVELPGKEDGQEWQFRPFVPITAYLRLKLWDTYQAEQEKGDR